MSDDIGLEKAMLKEGQGNGGKVTIKLYYEGLLRGLLVRIYMFTSIFENKESAAGLIWA